jgi:hypothetical protein
MLLFKVEQISIFQIIIIILLIYGDRYELIYSTFLYFLAASCGPQPALFYYRFFLIIRRRATYTLFFFTICSTLSLVGTFSLIFLSTNCFYHLMVVGGFSAFFMFMEIHIVSLFFLFWFNNSDVSKFNIKRYQCYLLQMRRKQQQ